MKVEKKESSLKGMPTLAVRTRAMTRAYEEGQRTLRQHRQVIALMERLLVVMKKKAKRSLQYASESEDDDDYISDNP